MPEAVAWPDGAALERVEVVAEPITESTDRVGGSRTLINREQLDWLQPQRVEELTALIPGAQPGNLQGGLDSSVMLRGFAITGPRWNGLPDIHRLFVRDPYTAERIEVISGPDAMLEGVSSPGGVLRYIGKRPQQQPAQEAAITVGSHGHRRLTADTTGPLSDRVAYRLTIAAQEGEQRPSRLSQQRHHLLAGLSWAYHAQGELRLEFEHQRNRTPFNWGTVYVDGLGPQFDTLYHPPSQQHSRRDYRRAALYWEHAVGDAWLLSFRAARADVRRHERIIGFWTGGVFPVPDSMAGYMADLRDRYWQEDLRLQAELNHSLFGRDHHLVLGFDSHRHDIRFLRGQNYQGYTVDRDTPDFSGIDFDALPRANHDRPAVSRRSGLHLSSQWQLTDRLRLGGGLRRTDFRTRSATETRPWETTQRGREPTWQAGVDYTVTTATTLYAHAGTGFNPNTGQDSQGRHLPPREARTIEGGLRHIPRPGRLTSPDWGRSSPPSTRTASGD